MYWNQKFSSSASFRTTETESPLTVRHLLDRAAAGQAGLSPLNLRWDDLVGMANVPVTPQTLYRSHWGTAAEVMSDGLRRSSDASGDDYYCGILTHTARLCGSYRGALSLTPSASTALRFQKRGHSFVTISTKHDARSYQPLGKIIHDHADRLMQEKKVLPATVLGALRNMSRYQENEYFYMGGNIPPHHISAAWSSDNNAGDPRLAGGGPELQITRL